MSRSRRANEQQHQARFYGGQVMATQEFQTVEVNQNPFFSYLIDSFWLQNQNKVNKFKKS